jgi:ribosomal 50S subunit-associated protein YjgA (DUF615 family)
MIWIRVPWGRMGLSKKRHSTDVFQHRLKKASYCRNVGQVIERLCKGLSIQSIRPPLGLLERVQRQEDAVLHKLRTESVVLTLLAKEGPEAIDRLTQAGAQEAQEEAAEGETK